MKKEPKTSLQFRMNIITYEWGKVVQSLVYMERFPNDSNAHKTNAKLELGDVLVQLDKLITQLNLNKEEIISLGYQHLRERYTEFERNEWVEI